MKHYTQSIPIDLAEKLKAKGMPMITSVSISIIEDKPVVDENGEQWYRPMFAEVFDWLMEQGVDMELSTRAFFLVWDKNGDPLAIKGKTWHEAANKAIEKALTLI